MWVGGFNEPRLAELEEGASHKNPCFGVGSCVVFPILGNLLSPVFTQEHKWAPDKMLRCNLRWTSFSCKRGTNALGGFTAKETTVMRRHQ